MFLSFDANFGICCKKAAGESARGPLHTDIQTHSSCLRVALITLCRAMDRSLGLNRQRFIFSLKWNHKLYFLIIHFCTF